MTITFRYYCNVMYNYSTAFTPYVIFFHIYADMLISNQMFISDTDDPLECNSGGWKKTTSTQWVELMCILWHYYINDQWLVLQMQPLPLRLLWRQWKRHCTRCHVLFHHLFISLGGSGFKLITIVSLSKALNWFPRGSAPVVGSLLVVPDNSICWIIINHIIVICSKHTQLYASIVIEDNADDSQDCAVIPISTTLQKQHSKY